MRAAIIITSLTVLLGAWQFGPRAWRLSRIWYWERQCLRFDPPVRTIAWEEIPATAAKPPMSTGVLDGDDPQVLALGTIGTGQTGAVRDVERYPVCFIRYYQVVGWQSLPGAVVFCHRLVSPAGHERLVMVHHPLGLQDGIGDEFEEFMSALAFRPGLQGKLSFGEECANLKTFVDWPHPGGMSPLPMPSRMYSGHADPQDSSRFTIEFEWPDGDHGILDGQLRDDDRVMLTVRGGRGGVDAERLRLFGAVSPFDTP